MHKPQILNHCFSFHLRLSQGKISSQLLVSEEATKTEESKILTHIHTYFAVNILSTQDIYSAGLVKAERHYPPKRNKQAKILFI